MSRSLQTYSRRKWRQRGYAVEAGERVSTIGKHVRRHDLFGFADLIAVRLGELIFIQVTSQSNMQARVNKIANDDHGLGQWRRPIYDWAMDLLSLRNVRIVVEGWRKLNGSWESREIEITPLLLRAKRKGQ